MMSTSFYTRASSQLLLLLACVFPLQAEETKEPLVLEDWIELVPLDERKNFNQSGMPVIDHNNIGKQNLIGNVRKELDDSYVKIPGYVIPLEGDEKTTTEFILAPYLGACIHVPPPPPNQIIYVNFPKGAPIQELWDVVYVVGTLRTVTVSHELAQIGYVLDGVEIEKYDDW